MSMLSFTFSLFDNGCSFDFEQAAGGAMSGT
jgi:hypothetical protein